MRQYFSKYGDVCDVVAMRDKTGNKSRGFGFVVFKEAESVDRCQAERPHQLLGKIVDTKRAMPKEESVNPDIHCNSKRIFIGGIRRFFTEDDLRDYFRNYGQVVDCTIKRDNVSGQSRGFAFITFTDRDIVDKVILSKPHIIKHCIVDVKKALSPEELRQQDENHTINNNNEFEGDYQRIYKNNQEPDDDTKSKEKPTIKKVPKPSQSYSPTEYSTAYMGYYLLSPELNPVSPTTTAFPFDHQVPLIWMSVQQCANGYILTPVSPDMFSTSYSPSYPPFYHSTMSSPPPQQPPPQAAPSSISGAYNAYSSATIYSPFQCLNAMVENATITSNNKRGNILSTIANDLKNVLPTDEPSNHSNSNHSINDCASEETAFGSPNSDSV